MRSNILETQYPILCEGIRRQRGDLAISLLDYCKDNPCRLKAVKEVLLDKSRYEGPSFVSEAERQNDARQNENDKKKSEDSSGVKVRGGFGLPNRRGRYYVFSYGRMVRTYPVNIEGRIVAVTCLMGETLLCEMLTWFNCK